MIRVEPDIHPFQITLTTLAGVLAQSSQRHTIAVVDTFSAEWDRLEFTYQGQPAMLIRIPKPEKTDKEVHKVAPNFYLSACLLVCPHQGCVVQTHRGNPQKLVCRCQGDVFWAKDGTLVAGVADRGLQRIELESVGNRVYPTGLSRAPKRAKLIKSKFPLELTMC